MLHNIYEKVEASPPSTEYQVIAKNGRGHQTSFSKLKSPKSKAVLWIGGVSLIALFALAYFFLMPVAEVAPVLRGTAISAVYGTVRIEPAFVVRVRAQNDGFIRLAEPFSAGRGAIGKSVERGQLLATIADQDTSRQLKQARADLQAAMDRAALPPPSSELLKTAEDNLQRLEKVVGSGNVPAVEYQKAKSEAKRLRDAVETERIERDRNLNSLEATTKKLEAQMKNAEVRSPIDGILTNLQTIDGELVSDGNELFTVSSRKTYVRGEVNEEDVGEVKPGMKAKLQLYAYRTRTFTARVTSVQPAADPTTQRYTIVLEMGNAPDNLMVGMTGEMNIITGIHENALLVPTRALLVDQALVVNGGIVQRRTVNVGFRTLDFSEVLSGLREGDHVVVSDQDKFHSGQPVRQRKVSSPPPPKAP
ncbi:MAG TPA: efflux RND transporter periplasmic adaptor subunit [Candidatus Udaeobacter sp.]|jgi:RND family efflux transporter MFP subunit|nr:efflux RND transporter periplasmic adaptor subunit [Candidatus Udaeobacter sp.]